MKALLLLFTLLSATALAASDVAPDSLIARAEAAYLAGDHTAALDLYAATAKGGTSAGLLFNIGNCHYKLGDHSRAILFYERALKLAPGDEDIRANRALARTHLKDRVNELPGSTLLSEWERMAGGRDPDHWARRSLWSFTALFVLLALSLFISQQWPVRILRVLAAIAAVYFLIALPMAVSRHMAVTDDSEAIIMAPKVDVRSEPRASGTALFVVHKGTKVTVLQSVDDWSEVKLANGSIGWMSSTDLEKI
jgi:tetratricopeptide (TPR) repeat protein